MPADPEKRAAEEERRTALREARGEQCVCDYYPEQCAVHWDTWWW